MKVPIVNLKKQYSKYKEEILYTVDKVLNSGNYVLGKELQSFEINFAKYCGTKYSIGVASGSDALTLSLLSLGINKDDEVITVPNSFVATVWTIANIGAKPIFVDIGNDYNINVELIEKSINKKTKAIIPVHLFGRVAQMDSLNEIAKNNNLVVIEDAAQSIGAEYKNKKSGSFGDTGCFSLHPLKNLHIYGDGGVITTDNENIYNYLKKIRNHGLKNRDECEFWGYNSRLDEIQAAIANIKLKYIDEINSKFRRIADIYSKNLSKKILTQNYFNFESPVFQRYMIIYKDREGLINYLNEEGIETKINYPIPLHLHEASKNLGYKLGDFPKSESFAKQTLSIPIYAELEDVELEFVISKINNYVDNIAKK